MTDRLEFTVDRNANPANDEVRAEILANPGFGRYHTDHMVSIDYVDGKGWHNARVMPYGPIELDPSAIVLHYAQEVFEGLKAYRWADGSIVSFRAEANAARLRSSARRLAIPELPEEVFIESLRQLIAVDGAVGAARRRRGVAVSAALHLRHRARPGRAARIRIPLPGDRLAGGGVLPARHQAGERVAVDGIRAGLPRRHRRGQVRRKLCRLAAGAGRGRRQRVRSGGVAGRHRTPLRRRDGRHEPVLRVRQRRLGAAGHPGAEWFAAARYHPGLVAAVGHRRRLRRRGAQDRRRRVAEEGGRRGDHRGVRLRHRRGHHPGVAGQVRRRRVHHRRRRARRNHDGPSRHVDRDPARHVRRHPRLDGAAVPNRRKVLRRMPAA